MKVPTDRLNWRNLAFAAIFVTLGAVAGVHAWKSLNFGTASAMGPGFFPVMLSIVLGVLGASVAFTPSTKKVPFRLAPLKAYLLVLGAPVAFALSIRSLGLVVAVAAVVFIASFASRFATLKGSILLTAGFTAFCVVVFHYLLNLPIPLWGTLITG